VSWLRWTRREDESGTGAQTVFTCLSCRDEAPTKNVGHQLGEKEDSNVMWGDVVMTCFQ
jgi:hypothetical protein